MGARDDSLAGHLLVAAPALQDPNFRRAVVLLIEHESEGAVGVVLNRPSEHDAEAALPELAPILGEGERLHEGGPVQVEAVIALAEYEEPAEAQTIVGPVGVLTGDVDVAELPRLVRRARVFLGYAGWGPGQLETELGEEAWFVEPARPGDVFDASPEDLWRRVLERKGGAFRLVARMPEDPTLN